MEWLEKGLDILSFCGTNKHILGICSLCGIIGFWFTILIALKTKKIEKVLHYNDVTEVYNKERSSYQKAFNGHMTSIIDDKICSDKILKNILRDIESYRAKFGDIISLSEKFELWKFRQLLRKSTKKVDFNEVCNSLAILSGRLSKKGGKKNG
jgi:hypothetical protein